MQSDVVVGLNVLYICILFKKIFVKITKNIRIIDLQKPLRRACNGIVIEEFKEDYSELLVHLYFESEVNLND